MGLATGGGRSLGFGHEIQKRPPENQKQAAATKSTAMSQRDAGATNGETANYGSRTSARAWASFSIVDCRLAESSTLKTRTERLIWRSRPVRTFPGPTSTNTVTPDSIISRT